MKLLSSILTVSIMLFTLAVNAQDFQVPETQPSTKDEFVKSEKDFIAAAKWLETTPLGKENATRKKINAWIIVWITNSPTVTETVYAGIIKPFDKNSDLLGVFMAGYARYILENKYDGDAFKGNLAGIRSVVNCVNLGGDIKKDKNLTKLMDADKDGKLEDWVKEMMKEK